MNLWYLVYGIEIGLILIWIIKGIKTPKQNESRGITLFGRIMGHMVNISGKRIYRGPDITGLTKFDLVNEDEVYLSKKNFSERTNIYFIPWPFCKEYEYPLTYVKAKRRGEESEGDTIVWESGGGRDILVSRTNLSNHLLFRSSYPIITNDLETKDMGKIILLTDNVLELINPMLAYTGTDNWMTLAVSILDGAFRGIISEKTLEEINLISTGDPNKEGFNQKVTKLVNGKMEDDPNYIFDPKNPKLKLGDIGFRLVRTIFRDFEPIGENTKKILEAISQNTIAEKEGEAKITKSRKDAESLKIDSEAKAKAHITIQEAEISMRKKAEIDTGRAKADANGNITELIPDANIKATSDAVAKLSENKGTLVLGGDMLKTLNINKNE